MTDIPKTNTSKPLARRILADRSFLIAAGVLLACAAGWPILARQIGLFLDKTPVPWPEGTVVRDDFRLDLDVRLGRYVMVANSDQVIDPETMQQLKIGSTLDKMRLESRTSNWYLSRVYERTDAKAASPYSAWYLQIFFYNGGTDTIPHVPERCRTQAGYRGMQSQTVQLTPSLAEFPEYADPLEIQRVLFKQAVPGVVEPLTRVEYYLFAFNGQPQADWKMVRLYMRDPFISHAYFAKIQFGPVGPGNIDDPEEANRQAEDFIRNVFPNVLANLPSAEDVKMAMKDE
ncbi:MAG: hypothetical protein ACLFUJ_08000 [Phycisphaerae bacterium]